MKHSCILYTQANENRGIAGQARNDNAFIIHNYFTYEKSKHKKLFDCHFFIRVPFELRK
jgi:hypothetical protein